VMDRDTFVETLKGLDYPFDWGQVTVYVKKGQVSFVRMEETRDMGVYPPPEYRQRRDTARVDNS